MEKQNLSLLELGKMMHAVIRAFKRRFDGQVQQEVKISIEQLSLLHAISKESEEVIQKDMAEMMGKDKSAILRLIDTLEEKELVRRVVDPKDRRKNYLMVTKSGNRVLQQYMAVVQDLMLELQTGLTQDEIDTFHKVTSHIKSAAEKL